MTEADVRNGRIVVLGSGTGVGKTHVAVSLLGAWQSFGVSARGLKPIETGVEIAGSIPGEVGDLDDSERLARASSGAARLAAVGNALAATTDPRSAPDSNLAAPYRFRPPVSPHLAARQAGIRIDLAEIRRWVLSHSMTTVVETAGGLFSPLGLGVTNYDLAIALEPCVWVLVAPDRIGVLHDVTATLGYARALGRSVDAVVLSAATDPDASTGNNAPELERLGITRVAGVFPRSPSDSELSLGAARELLSDLAACPIPKPSCR